MLSNYKCMFCKAGITEAFNVRFVLFGHKGPSRPS
jgi:hypothetical protein